MAVYGVFEVINEGTSGEVHVLLKAFISEYKARQYANTSYMIVKEIEIDGGYA